MTHGGEGGVSVSQGYTDVPPPTPEVSNRRGQSGSVSARLPSVQKVPPEQSSSSAFPGFPLIGALPLACAHQHVLHVFSRQLGRGFCPLEGGEALRTGAPRTRTRRPPPTFPTGRGL